MRVCKICFGPTRCSSVFSTLTRQANPNTFLPDIRTTPVEAVVCAKALNDESLQSTSVTRYHEPIAWRATHLGRGIEALKVTNVNALTVELFRNHLLLSKVRVPPLSSWSASKASQVSWWIRYATSLAYMLWTQILTWTTMWTAHYPPWRCSWWWQLQPHSCTTALAGCNGSQKGDGRSSQQSGLSHNAHALTRTLLYMWTRLVDLWQLEWLCLTQCVTSAQTFPQFASALPLRWVRFRSWRSDVYTFAFWCLSCWMFSFHRRLSSCLRSTGVDLSNRRVYFTDVQLTTTGKEIQPSK